MKHKIFCVFILIILVFSNYIPVKTAFKNKNYKIENQFRSVLNLNSVYYPEDIDIRDAAFHRSNYFYNLEWWYFEGIFENGYSIVIAFLIISKQTHGQGLIGVQIYKDNKFYLMLHENFTFNDIIISEEFPYIKISEKCQIKFDIEHYNTSREWLYNISLEFENNEINLFFTGLTKGYKGEILRGWYSPVLPKAYVNGSIMLNDEKINVNGYGYHEHAWEIYPLIIEWGWYWGKIVSETYTLAWAKMMNTRWWEKTRSAILSQDQAGYININPEKIQFKASKYKLNYWRFIPTEFVLNIIDPENLIYVNISIETLNIHNIKVFKIFNYWRYHVMVNGEITLGSSTETIENEIQVLELMRFR
jgi:hypothetical protein